MAAIAASVKAEPTAVLNIRGFGDSELALFTHQTGEGLLCDKLLHEKTTFHN